MMTVTASLSTLQLRTTASVMSLTSARFSSSERPCAISMITSGIPRHYAYTCRRSHGGVCPRLVQPAGALAARHGRGRVDRDVVLLHRAGLPPPAGQVRRPRLGRRGVGDPRR